MTKLEKSLGWKILIDKKAKKELLKLNKVAQQQIDKFIQKLETSDNPRKYGEALKGKLHLFWKYRVGSYRLMCEIQDNVLKILVIKIDHRKDVYKDKK